MERTVNDTCSHMESSRKHILSVSKEPKIRTVRFHFNIFSGTPNPQYSNFNYEEPQDGWVEMTPRLMSSLMRFRHSGHEMFMS